ncbi:hypothetical protein, partial [Paenibacillus sp. 2TAB19]|uniref:hypothetical protein n=1 Tax=Paenibacillus sp. 2TAB19 TaxID=3233003 RepID=UPI003F980B0E
NKVLVFFIFNLFIISGCSIFQESDKSTSISIQKVGEVLMVDHTPSLPDKWEINSVEKYDDGFVNPSVTIKYSNGVTITLSKSKWDLSKEFKNNKSVRLGNKQMLRYYNAKEDAYVFELASINYAVKSPNHLRVETEKAIADLL